MLEMHSKGFSKVYNTLNLIEHCSYNLISKFQFQFQFQFSDDAIGIHSLILVNSSSHVNFGGT